ERVRLRYLQRLERLTKASLAEETTLSSTTESVQRLQYETLTAERMALIDLRDNGTISDEVLHRLEQELDVAALHLGVGERRPGRTHR
ncbi:MAG TPA: Na+/H+ antiporter, partial [Nitrospira sp.]|nr:Na+/H+ antiporter [Nitrospira sp.]